MYVRFAAVFSCARSAASSRAACRACTLASRVAVPIGGRHGRRRSADRPHRQRRSMPTSSDNIRHRSVGDRPVDGPSTARFEDNNLASLTLIALGGSLSSPSRRARLQFVLSIYCRRQGQSREGELWFAGWPISHWRGKWFDDQFTSRMCPILRCGAGGSRICGGTDFKRLSSLVPSPHIRLAPSSHRRRNDNPGVAAPPKRRPRPRSRCPPRKPHGRRGTRWRRGVPRGRPLLRIHAPAVLVGLDTKEAAEPRRRPAGPADPAA